MMRLSSPKFQSLDIFDACTAEMKDKEAERFHSSRNALKSQHDLFDQASNDKTWYRLPRCKRGEPNKLIAGDLTKKHLMDLYSDRVVPSDGRPREMYTEILREACDKCPYCAGIGSVRTLDHYLPKAIFPAFSVHPMNLIPSCRDCNADARDSFPSAMEEQPIHPYLDEDIFFNERWVYATVRRGNPIMLDYFADPPTVWSEDSRRRACSHFEAGNLAVRFSVQAPGELGTLIQQRKTSLLCLSEIDFRKHLAQGAHFQKEPLNGWRRTMYQALCDSDWFCSADFSDDASSA